MSKPLVTRVGERIVRIRFELECDKPYNQYLSIVNSMPDDRARREWLAKGHDITIVDGWAEVTPR